MTEPRFLSLKRNANSMSELGVLAARRSWLCVFAPSQGNVRLTRLTSAMDTVQVCQLHSARLRVVHP